jgi:hypothetical protein
MTIAGGEVVAARESVLRRTLALLLARNQETEAALFFACRSLTRALDANLARQPRGWRDDQDPAGDVAEAGRDVVRRALALLLAERNLAADDTVDRLMRAEAALYFAARRLATAVDADPRRQPRGWREADREAARS